MVTKLLLEYNFSSGVVVALLGIAVVFLVLLILVSAIILFSYLESKFNLLTKLIKKAKEIFKHEKKLLLNQSPIEAEEIIEPVVEKAIEIKEMEPENNNEIIAAITAAISVMLSVQSQNYKSKFIVRDIKRIK